MRRAIRKLPVLWYYALKMRGARSTFPFPSDPGLMVRVATSANNPYADLDE